MEMCHYFEHNGHNLFIKIIWNRNFSEYEAVFRVSKPDGTRDGKLIEKKNRLFKDEAGAVGFIGEQLIRWGVIDFEVA